MQFKGKSSKASSKKCYWENAFPLWCVQLVSWLRLANCSHWFSETSWFFSPQSLPYDNNPQGYSAQWKQKSLMWMAAAGSGLFLLSWWTVCCCIHFGSKSTWRYSELTGQKTATWDQPSYTDVLNWTQAFFTPRMLRLWIFCMALRI